MTDLFDIKEPANKGSSKLNSLLIISHRLTGKTEALLQLPNCLLIDLEGHASSYSSKANVFVPKEALIKRNEKALKEGKTALAQKPIGMVTFLKQFAEFLATSPKKYDFIVWDTLTALEQVAMPLSVVLFKNTSEGSSYQGNNVVTDLGFGKGQAFLRAAVEQIIKPFSEIAKECLIYTGHVNSKVAIVGDKEIDVSDLDLTSQVKKIFTGNTSATGLIYRDATGTTNKINFINKGDSHVVGARPEHLSNKEFIFSQKLNEKGESDFNGKLTTHWENIFPGYFNNINKQKTKKD